MPLKANDKTFAGVTFDAFRVRRGLLQVLVRIGWTEEASVQLELDIVKLLQYIL